MIISIDEIYQTYQDVKLTIQQFNFMHRNNSNFSDHYDDNITQYFNNSILKNKFSDVDLIRFLSKDVVLDISFVITMKLSTGQDVLFYINSINLSKFFDSKIHFNERIYLFFIEKVKILDNGNLKHIMGITKTSIEDNIFNSLEEWCMGKGVNFI